MSQTPPTQPSFPPPLPPAGAVRRRGAPFTAGEILSDGWRIMSTAYWPFVGANAAFNGILIGVSMVPMIGGLAVIGLMPMAAALKYMGCRRAKGQPVRAGNLFEVFNERQYLPLLCIQLLSGLIIGAAYLPFLVGLPIAIVVGIQRGAGLYLGIAIGCLSLAASMVVGAYLAGRVLWAGPLFMDAPPRALDIMEAIKLSWRVTRPHQWRLMGVILIEILLNLLSTLMLFVGQFFLSGPLAIGVAGAVVRRISPYGDDFCPRCGYSTIGLTLPLCPECGEHLPAPRTP